jgi:hypothetical protein
MYNLTDFENFIYACEGMLVNAGFDIIEWKPHFKKELWEKNSFLANGKMKTAQKVWQVKQKQINEHAHHSKTNIKHLILVKKNQEVKNHVKSELLRVNEMYEAFADKHKLNNSDALINNEWFFAIRDLIIDLTQWFEGFTYRQANKETRYDITLFDEDNSRNFHEYKFIERQINQVGYFKVNEAKIYTPELSYFLTSKAFSVLNLDEDKEEKINCLNYLNTYLDAFKKGEEYFDNEFKVNPSTLYGSNAEHYVKDIHQNYFHVKHAGLQSGWVFVKNKFPTIITHKEIDNYGYYSGIVSKVDEQVRKYTQLFANFDKCEHNQKGNAGEDVIKNELKDLFTIENYEDYIDALVNCEPQLLKKKEGKYSFVGNEKKQKTCVSSWFKYLKSKGIVNQSINRKDIATILSACIENYSVAGSSVDTYSEEYKDKFEKQLTQYLDSIN